MFNKQRLLNHGVHRERGTRTRAALRSRHVAIATLLLLAGAFSGSLSAQLIGVQLGTGTDIAPQQNTDLRTSNYLTVGGSCSFWMHHHLIWHNAVGVGYRTTRDSGIPDHLFLRTGLRGFSTQKWYLQAGMTLRTPLSQEPSITDENAPADLSNVLIMAQASVGKYFRGYEIGFNAGIPVNTAVMDQTASFDLSATKLIRAGTGKNFRTKRLRKKRYMPFGDPTWEDRARQHRQ